VLTRVITAFLSAATAAARVTDFAVIPLERIRLRGRVKPIEVHALVGDETVRESPSFRELCARHMDAREPESPRATAGLPGRTA
jgi:hypothetical protein